jgi:predicted metal-dependent phosphoesterase TrpH
VELAELRQRCDFPIFAGVEVSTDLGHVLAFGLRSAIAPSAAELFAIARKDGGLLYLAHPARDGLLKVSRETVEYFASVEAVNGSDSRLQNLATTGLAKGFSRPGIGGSDAHTSAEVGRAATRFPGVISDDKALLAALRAGDYEAVSL